MYPVLSSVGFTYSHHLSCVMPRYWAEGSSRSVPRLLPDTLPLHRSCCWGNIRLF